MPELLLGAVAVPAAGEAAGVWRKRRVARERGGRVELAMLDAAANDAYFARETLESEAEQLVRSVLMAAAARDEARLGELVAPGHLKEVAREPGFLGDVRRLPFVEFVEGPALELVNVINRDGESGDRVVFRCRARVNYPWLMTTMPIDDVRNLDEYWTLCRHDGRWVLRVREPAVDGKHHANEA